jgi:ribonuclease HII
MRASGKLEESLRSVGYARIAGADEAGRGALFGPVYAAAVVLDPARPIPGLADSKTLEPARRAELSARIRQRALCWAVAAVSPAGIDRLNILEASRLALRRAVGALNPPCDYLLVDALHVPWPVPQQAIVKGDAKVRCIAAASILAKTGRDACLDRLDELFPGYGLRQNKGYPTEEHRRALRRLGPSPLHRRSYAPVREALQLAL